VLTQNPSAPANSFVVNASGNVGIGTSSPAYKLDVIGQSSLNGIRVGLNGDTINGSNSLLAFQVNGTEAMRIDSNGNVLVGATTTSGSASNLKTLTAGEYLSFSGETGSAASGTPVTIFTATRGLFTVCARLPAGQGDVGNYMSYAIVLCDGAVSRVIANNASLLVISLSGNTVRVAQSSGGTQPTISWSVMKQNIG
jgi:hypothetical protein